MTDPLSDLLGFTKAKSVAAGGFTAGGAWAFRVPAHGQLAFAAIAKGTCWVRLDGQTKASKMVEGDVGLLCVRTGFVIGSSPTAAADDVELDDGGGEIVALNKGSECLVLFGRLSLQPSSADVLKEVLPATVYMPASYSSGDDIRRLVDMLRRERCDKRPGASAVARMLAELIFVQLLRTYVETSTALPPGWLRAAADERLLRALRAMHRDPGHPWTITELAGAAAMSRTRFAVHFRSVAGVAPLAYLGEWRMRLAKRILREESVSVAAIAERLGYATESGFSNAFKRIVGVPPRRYRATAKQEKTTNH
jgi:AraC-like DNA-binding protein